MIKFELNNNLLLSDSNAIRDIQEKLLRKHLAYCKKQSPYYRKALKDTDVKSGLDQLAQLPFTEKREIELHNNDFCAVAQNEIVDIVLSSGTTGKPIKMMYTEFDLKRLAYNEEKSFRGCGITPNDVVLLTCTMDRCFVAGLAYFLGIRNIGASAIRNGHGSLESHHEIILKMNPTVIIGVPTFLLKLGLYLNELRVDLKKLSVTKLVCIGEPLRDKNLELLRIGKELQDIWQAKVFSTYASSEIVTTFCECTAQQGGHLHPDLAIVEIVNKDGAMLPPGEIGEVVVTPLVVEGMPLLRFKTGDISFLITEPCSCGSFSPRLGPILGRQKQMLKLKGTTLYPQAIYSALEEIKAVSEYYLVATSENKLSDNIVAHVAVNDESYTAEAIQNKLQAHLRVKPDVIIAGLQEIRNVVFTPKSRKPIRFIDKRYTL